MEEVVRDRQEMTFEDVLTPKQLKQTDNKLSVNEDGSSSASKRGSATESSSTPA